MAGKGQQEGYAKGGQTRGGRVAPTPIGARPRSLCPLRKKAKKEQDGQDEEEYWDEEPAMDCDEEPEEPEEGDGRWVRAVDIQGVADACEAHALDLQVIAEKMGSIAEMARAKQDLMRSCAEVMRSWCEAGAAVDDVAAPMEPGSWQGDAVNL